MDGSPTFINYLNVAAFTLSWLLNSEVDVSPEIDFFSFLGGMRNLGRQNESLVTPTENTFLVSHFVLLFLGIFTVVQMFPKYRLSPLVQEGVSYYFFASSVAQLLWCMNLSLENSFGAFLSIGFMGAMLIFNLIVLLKQSSLSDEYQEPEEYWLLRFAFSLQAGWSIVMFVMVLNSFQAFAGYDFDFQYFSAFFSLLFFASISGKMLFANGDKPNFVIPSVIAWFVLGFAFDNNSENENYQYYGKELKGFAITSAIVGFSIAIATANHFYIRYMKTNSNKSTIKKKMNPTDYVHATDDFSHAEEEDEVSYVAPRNDDDTDFVPPKERAFV